MSTNNDAEYLLVQLRAKQEDHKGFLASGKASDYAEYRQICGFIRGLEAAEQMITDLAKRREQDADE